MRDSSENANAFPSCVGAFGEALQSPAGAAGQVRPHRRSRRGGSPPAPRKASIWSGDQPHRITW